MTRWIASALVLMLASSFNACLMKQGAPSAEDQQQMDQHVQAYFRKAANLPADVTLKLTDVAPSDVPGLLSATLEASRGGNSQKVPLLLSRDGRFMIQGKLIDLSIDPDKAIMSKISLKDEPIRGNPAAPVTIVEYSDFQCPFCGRAYKIVEDQVLKDYGDKVRLIYKNFPLTNIHPWAESGALAAACARQQSPEAFWKMYDYLFQNQTQLNLNNVKDKTVEQAKQDGLDAAKFAACFDNKSAMPLVKADEEEASALGVRSTPTFFINGHRVEGAVPYEQFKTAIDAELGGGKPQTGASQPTPNVAHPG